MGVIVINSVVLYGEEVWRREMSGGPHVSEDTHRMLHIKPKPFRYEPVSVTEKLRELSLYLKTVVELGTYSYLSGEKWIARHIIDLESAVDSTAYQLLIHAALTVGHNVSKAIGALPLYIYVLGADKVTDAFKDLAYLSISGYGPTEEIYRYYVYLSDVVTAKVKGRDWLVGKSVGYVKEEYAVEPIAILRGGRWILIPTEDVIIEEGDRLYVNGVKENINDLLKALGKPELIGEEPPNEVREIMTHIDSMIDIIYLLNDLAHYQMKAQDPEMVEEVMEIESFFDSLRLKVSDLIMKSEALSSRNKYALLMLTTRLEDITDAIAYSITLPAKDEYREVLSEMVESSGERVRLFKLAKKIEATKLADELEELGASVLAVRKGGEWVAITPYNIRKVVANPGDEVLVMYPTVLEDELIQLMSRYGKEEEIEEVVTE